MARVEQAAGQRKGKYKMTKVQEQKKDFQGFLSVEKVTRYHAQNGQFNDSLIDSAVKRALSGRANSAILSVEKQLRYSEDAIQHARLKAWEMTVKLSEEAATEKDMLRAIVDYNLPINLEWDRPSKLQCMVPGAYVKYIGYHVARYVMRELVREHEALNSCILNQRFDESTGAEVGELLQDLRQQVDAEERIAFLDVEVMLSPRQLQAWRAMVAGLSQREITQSLRISPKTQCAVRRKVWEYLADTNRY
jgi:hypothetical protein